MFLEYTADDCVRDCEILNGVYKHVLTKLSRRIAGMYQSLESGSLLDEKDLFFMDEFIARYGRHFKCWTIILQRTFQELVESKRLNSLWYMKHIFETVELPCAHVTTEKNEETKRLYQTWVMCNLFIESLNKRLFRRLKPSLECSCPFGKHMFTYFRYRALTIESIDFEAEDRKRFELLEKTIPPVDDDDILDESRKRPLPTPGERQPDSSDDEDW